MARRINNRMFYFTIEDESILAESFTQFEADVFAITYKVFGSEDVFVMTSETGRPPTARAISAGTVLTGNFT